MHRAVRRLGIDQQLKTIVAEHMKLKEIEVLDQFMYENDRKVYLLVDKETRLEANRLESYTN